MNRRTDTDPKGDRRLSGKLPLSHHSSDKREVAKCSNPNRNNPQFCPYFELPDKCYKKEYCDWKKKSKE